MTEKVNSDNPFHHRKRILHRVASFHSCPCYPGDLGEAENSALARLYYVNFNRYLLSDNQAYYTQVPTIPGSMVDPKEKFLKIQFLLMGKAPCQVINICYFI